MTFTPEIWKQQATERFRQAGNWLKRRTTQDAPYLVYGTLCSLSLWPLVQAAQTGRLSPVEIGIALGGVAGSVGTNLLANQIQRWKDRADEVDEAEVAEWFAENAPANSELREALDAILEKMETISQVQVGLKDADRQWFSETLQAELAQLGNQARFEAQLIGDGLLVQGDQPIGVQQQDQGQAAIHSQIEGDMLGPGASITYILNQYLTQEEQPSDPTTLHCQIDTYLTWLRDRCGTIELRGIKREGQQVVQLDLNEVYVPLEAYSYQGSQSIGLNEVMEPGRRIIITGGPGSGKTTVLLHIAWTVATAIATDRPDLVQEKLGLKDNLFYEFKTMLEDVVHQAQRKHWFKYEASLLRLEATYNKATQLAQIGPDDPLQNVLEVAQEKTDKIKKIVREAGEAKRKWKETENYAKQLADDSEASERKIETAREDVVKFKMNYEQAERQVSEMADEAEQVKVAIEETRRLALEKKDSLPLPIFIPLSAYAAYLRRLPSTSEPHESTLATFISRYLIERQSGFDLPGDFFRQILRDGRAVILLLDGLDEVPNEAERVRVRQAIEELVTGRETIQAVVTCRTAAYRERTALGKGFREVRVSPLNDEHIEALVERAYGHIYRSDSVVRQSKADELLEGIRDMEEARRRRLGTDVERLVSSPLLVRMLLVVHFSERRLPEQRAELYMKATDAMLLPEYAPDEEVADRIGRLVGGSREVHRDLVQHLAFTMHSQGEEKGREITEDELYRVLKSEPSYAELVDDFIALTRLRGTLLEERLRVYRFIHLAFQEYMTARYLAEVVRSVEEIVVFFLEKGRILDSWWREPALLVAGYLSVMSPRTARAFLRRLSRSEGTPEMQMAGAEVAATALLEWPAFGEDLKREVGGRLLKLCQDSEVKKRISLSEWIAAGRVLGLLGDPREGVTTLPPLLTPPIRGKFLYGEEKVEREVGPFQAGVYPVTNAQFAHFIEAGGYDNVEWWSEEGWQYRQGEKWFQPRSWDNVTWNNPNHPVVGVSWYEAEAFCNWLTDVYGQPYRLPTEEEWERLARGQDGREYPWGNGWQEGVSNTKESKLGQTTAVGLLPQDISPAGAYDCAGNVREWCLDWYSERTRNWRVLRGGSWFNYRSNAHCSFRDYYLLPLNRFNFIGFRVACHVTT